MVKFDERNGCQNQQFMFHYDFITIETKVLQL